MAPVQIALLFTDIEGSTRRWDAYPEPMRDAVRRHDVLVRAEIERHGGHVFKALGDAFCAAFPRVGQALTAAVGVQRALGEQDFSAVDCLRVRAAISWGEADFRDDDYFGNPVNRVSRLLTAGNGGQILVSQEVASALVPQELEDVTLRELGTVTLRDFKDPVIVYQVFADGLPAEAKPLRTLRTPANNLPQQGSSFIGRNADVRHVQALLERHALVTIGGAGGLGKTRLALETARAALNDRKDGTWFVDLASIVDGELVPTAILTAIGGEPAQDRTPLEALLTHLRSRETLVILDNCEHVIAQAATVASAILQRCPHVAMLATSRERLDVAGEQFYQLDTLDLDTAVALFNERATAARRGFSAAEDREAVYEVCRRLDGIALGIELAASAVRAMPVRKLLEHFDLRLLSGGRDRQPRQKTMTALIEWSYDLLDAAQRDLLRRCATCLGGFTLESATALALENELETIERLSTLVDKSLISADPVRARYRLLEPIREFALGKLAESAELPAALESHACVYRNVARDGYVEWDTAPGADWLERMEADLGNMRAALSWCAANEAHAHGAALAADAAPVFLRLSLLSEGIEACRHFLDRVDETAPELRARLCYVLSMLCQNLAQLEQSFEYAQRAADLYRQLPGETRALARALSQLAHRYSVQSRIDEAIAVSEEATRLARSLSDRRLLADVLRRSAPAFAAQPEQMDRMYEESVMLFRSLGNADETARALVWWGQSQARSGRYRGAAEHLMEARVNAGRELSSMLLAQAVSCYLMIGEHESATALAREELSLNAAQPHPVETPLAIAHVAAIAGERDPKCAAVLAGHARARLTEAKWTLDASDAAIARRLSRGLEASLSQNELEQLLSDGAAIAQSEALAKAARLLDTLGESSIRD